MSKRSEGVLKISKGIFKRAITILPILFVFGSAGVLVDGVVNFVSISKDLNMKSMYVHRHITSISSRRRKNY